MYSKNITTFLMHLLGKDGAKQSALVLNTEDEITRETLLTQDGAVVHAAGQGAGYRRDLDDVDHQRRAEDGGERHSRSASSLAAIKTIGRAPRADFIVDAALVSRVHCRLTAGAAELEVVDLESTNGTYVNGARVERAVLKNGDTLGVGKVEFVVSRSTGKD